MVPGEFDEFMMPMLLVSRFVLTNVNTGVRCFGAGWAYNRGRLTN